MVRSGLARRFLGSSVPPFRHLQPAEQLDRLDEVVDALLPRYDLAPAGRTLLQFENNAVFQVVATSGERFVVRVAPPWGRGAAEQRSELQWLESLRLETGLAVPGPVRNRLGELNTTVQLPGSGEAHPCVVLRWVAGEPPEPGLAPAAMEQVGAFVAGLHRSAERFRPGPGFVRPRWDWERLCGPGSILHDGAVLRTLAPPERSILRAAGERTRRVLAGPDRPAWEVGLIHADLHRDNILLSPAGVGAIDFDDCGFGFFLYDLACILESFERRVFADPAERRAGREALLEGYAEVRPLAPDFAESLGVFTALRHLAILDFILRSPNPTVHEWGRPRVAAIIAQIQVDLGGG